jgi:hypothetical protein
MPLGDVLTRFAARALGRTPAAKIEVGPPAPVDAARPYHVAWLEHNLPTSFRKGEHYQVYLRVENRGSRHWHANHPEGQWVELAVYIGAALQRTARIPRDVAPGEDVLLTIPVAFPPDAEDGKWTVTVSFVEQNVAWFHESGMEPPAPRDSTQGAGRCSTAGTMGGTTGTRRHSSRS